MFRLRIARYVVVGAFNTAVSYLVYAALLRAGLRFEVANLFACAAGVLIGYQTHLKYVFADAASPRLWRYALVWTLLYGLNVLVIGLFMKVGFDAYVAGALAIPLMVGTSYFVNKLAVFRAPT